MKVAIIGSRSLGEEVYPSIIENMPPNVSEIISGGAQGIDTLAERAARELHLPIRVFRPDYSSGLGKLAPLRRNADIVDNADFVLIFWDGISRGTQNVIKNAMATGKPMRVIRFDN